jgi:RHS repeat-associated protein
MRRSLTHSTMLLCWRQETMSAKMHTSVFTKHANRAVATGCLRRAADSLGMNNTCRMLVVILFLPILLKANTNVCWVSYNDRSEISRFVCGTLDVSWEYDQMGNRIRSMKPNVTNYYTSNSRNQYVAISNNLGGTVNIEYDADGNLIKDHRLNYRWDGENRLVATWPVFFTNGGIVVKNSYDYLHRRVKKEVQQLVDFDHTQPSSPTNGRLISLYSSVFFYDRNRIVLELTTFANGSQSTNQYVWGRDLSGTLDGAAGIGGLLAVQSDDNWYFPFYDGSGNITAYVDESGSMVAQYYYDPFGESIFEQGTHKDIFHFRFSTKYLDDETGLYNFGRRFYDPWLGRWLSPDPIGENGGLNTYCFVVNDPINNVDALGLYTLDDAKTSLETNGVPKTGSIFGIPVYSDKQVFDEWLRLEHKNGSWWTSLPKCPASICIDKKGKPRNPDKDKWDDPKKGGVILAKYHPGGTYEMRTSKSASGDPHGNQCIYDKKGSAPSEARRFLRGGSPRRVRTSHPLVPSVGTMEEESNPNEVV